MEWWMGDFAGKVFAIIGRYSEPLTLREANVLIGSRWRMLQVCATTFEVENTERGYDQYITHIEKLTTEDPIGTLRFERCDNKYFYLTWTPRGSKGEKYNLTQCCIPVGNLIVHPRGGGHHASHATPTYDAVSILVR